MTYPGHNEEMIVVTVNIPKKLNTVIMMLKVWGLVPSRSEAVRQGTIKYCLDLYNLKKDVDNDLENFDPEKFVRVPNDDGTYNMHELLRRLD